MEFSEIVAITGMPGLFRSVAQRPDGMIVSALGEDKSRFVSARIHMFTPLENITIYTEDDSVSLKEVFALVFEKRDSIPLPEISASNDELKSYFEKILPEYDKDRVYVSDIKKVVKWFNAIEESGVLSADLFKEASEDDENKKVDEDVEKKDSEEVKAEESSK